MNYVWEQRKLGEVFEQTTNFVNLSKDDIELWSLTVEDGLTPKSERYNREFLVKKDTNFKEVRPGDIVYNPMNMTLGAVGYNGMSKSVAISGYYTTMITKDGNDSYYINTWLKSPQAISLYKIYATGSLIEKQRVQFPTLSTIPAVFPKYEEQHKIGCYFEAIDHLITLHQRKIYIFIKKMPIDWEQRKLGEVLVSLQNNTLSRADLSNETGIAKNVHYGDVLIKFGEVLDVSEEKLPMISDKSVLTKYKASFLQNGDVIVADTAEDSTVGKCSEIAGLNDEVVLSGLHTIPYRPIEKFASGYLGYYLNSSAYHKQLIPLMQGIKVTSISKSAMQNTEIVYPKSVEEQGKIGNYFQSLDHLITLHHRKCIILRKMKVNDWEQRKVGDYLTESREIGNKGDVARKMTVKLWGKGVYEKLEAGSTNTQYFIRHANQFIYSKLDFLNCAFGVVPEELESLETTADVPAFDCVYMNPYFMFYRTIQPSFYIQNGIIANGSRKAKRIHTDTFLEMPISVPCLTEQNKIVGYFQSLDHLITLHHRKRVILKKTKVSDWEQRKFSELYKKVNEKNIFRFGVDKIISVANMYFKEDVKKPNDEYMRTYNIMRLGDIAFEGNKSKNFSHGRFVENTIGDGIVSHVFDVFRPVMDYDLLFWKYLINNENVMGRIMTRCTKASTMMTNLVAKDFLNENILVPTIEEQHKIGTYIDKLDHLITLHHHEEFCTENVLIYIEINKTIQIKEDIMAELESVIEQKLIDQLVYGDSQWTYRADLKTEEDLWNNFRYILVQNNKDRLNGEPLSDTEFEQVKNQLQFSSFYKAGEWLVGENGKVMVHVQRDTERLHLVVMNHEHIAGGSSVYEVINQYRALADEESQTKAQDRRFDVTLMINGLPMIHIELKNKQHSYMDGFWQIKKYIGEGKFTGIFSAVQMFVISNGVDTKYFSAASDTELNSKFISGWLDNENNPVPDYLDFAKSVLRIPEAHEMIARYTVLDEEAKRLILLRPYQIHAIEAIREASKTGKSGFVWHTTGSGKTLTSYKATRNLLMDIPSIDKAIFLIDRKDLDTQTSMAFRTYANNDLVDVDQTDNVFDLKKKLKSDDRQMIVTTIQKLQRLITKKLAEGTPEYNKIKSLKIAFVVDECHRAVTPGTKRELERFFANSLWYGFTGTPRFAENPYPQLGDLPRTTEELYGERLHRYTIQNAIHDNAVLGFQVEHNGPKNMDDETDSSMYENETHMLRVLDVILNKSYHKLGFQNGKGKTYEGLLTTSSIQLAQKYYELLKRVKNGETELQIDEKVKQILPDFPKFAITYSVTENEEGSHLNQEKMKESINDYNEMFGTKLDISQIQSYNANLNKRLARKEPKFQSRSEQLDLVIVVDRLLTGFDAPCMSTLFVDRQPMGPHDLIQAFSRTNRIFDKNKTYGQIVTFQAPKLFKECVDNAVKLYSAGSTEIALLAEWEEIEPAFRKALKALRVSAETPAEIPVMSEKEKVLFVKAFQHFDKLFAQLKSFTQYEDSMLTEYGISEDEYDDYAGHYLNVKEELKAGAEDTQSEMEEQPIDVDYELMAYSNTKIDYEYIINLIQNIVTPDEDVEITPEERQKQLEEVKQYIDDLRKENPKVADIMSTLVSEIEQDEVKYKGQSILNIVENMKHECIEKVVMDFSITWYVSKDDVMYAATHYRNGEIPNESAIKSTADFTSFKEAQERAIPKFKYYNMMIEELRKTLEEEIKPLLNN